MILDADDAGNLVVKTNGHDGDVTLMMKDGSLMTIAERDGRIFSCMAEKPRLMESSRPLRIPSDALRPSGSDLRRRPRRSSPPG